MIFKTELPIQDRLRAQYTKRWITVGMTRDQSVAEHSFNVALIAAEISDRLGMSWEKKHRCISEALFHDLDEVVTGDIPTPTKRRLNNPAVLDKTKHDVDPLALAVVKAADQIEACYHITQHADGIHAFQVKSKMMENMERFHDMKTDVSVVAKEIWGELMDGDRSW